MAVEHYYGVPMNSWANNLKEVDSDLAKKLFEGPDYKQKMIKEMEEMGLPCLKNIVTELDYFVKNKEEIFSQFTYPADYINIINKNTGERNREEGLSKDDINNFIDEVVGDSSNYKDYKILISESPPMPYNGVLIIESSDRFVLEMVKGPLPDLVSLGKIPDFRVTKGNLFDRENSFDLSIKYSGIDDDNLKNEILKVIQLTKFKKGYYEFCLAKTNPDSEKLSPFFFEYSDKSTYSLDQKV